MEVPKAGQDMEEPEAGRDMEVPKAGVVVTISVFSAERSQKIIHFLSYTIGIVYFCNAIPI